MVSQKKGMNSAPCLACDGTDYRHVLDAFDFASATTPFHIIECGCCGLARTEPSLSGDELAEYYKPAYYGSGTEKFVGVIEAYTVLADWCWAGTILSRWKTQKKGYPRVLDVGCGRGNLLRALSTRGCECHGVERKEFPNNPTSKQYQNYQGDIGEIGFDTGFFDVVILCHVLEHFENPVEALLELSRVLRHGGLLVLAVPNSSSTGQIIRCRLVSSGSSATYSSFYPGFVTGMPR